MTENDVVAALAMSAAEPTLLADDELAVFVVPPGGKVETIDLEAYGEAPRRAAGTTTLLDLPSFVWFYKQHAGEGVPLYASASEGTVTAVFNDHGANGPGWGDHRAVLKLSLTPEWQHWASLDRKLMTQEQFAEHIEGGLAQIIQPAAADMLELVQDFSAMTKVTFRSSHRLASGARRLTYAEDTAASGSDKSIEVPSLIKLAAIVYRGQQERDPFEARFRYQVRDGVLKMSYVIVELDSVLQRAFEAITEQLATHTGSVVLNGVPAVRR
jgi:uncharacterized protein YfdQ (DUF2303 family)